MMFDQGAQIESLLKTLQSQTVKHQEITRSLEGALQKAVQTEFDKS
jgi:hypothetical protein